ncbi:MAG: hypothetical protein JW841_01895 [Deltaproteobacteria bacterium]|nr:hypothetical protein [Deltaproteobacteria bacterium]
MLACSYISLTAIILSSTITSNTTRFKLERQTNSSDYQLFDQLYNRRLVIPFKWLTKEQSESDDLIAPVVAAENFATKTNWFAAGNGRIGIHLSSYDIQNGGSLQLAEGRVLLIRYMSAV